MIHPAQGNAIDMLDHVHEFARGVVTMNDYSTRHQDLLKHFKSQSSFLGAKLCNQLAGYPKTVQIGVLIAMLAAASRMFGYSRETIIEVFDAALNSLDG